MTILLFPTGAELPKEPNCMVKNAVDAFVVGMQNMEHFADNGGKERLAQYRAELQVAHNILSGILFYINE